MRAIGGSSDASLDSVMHEISALLEEFATVLQTAVQELQGGVATPGGLSALGNVQAAGKALATSGIPGAATGSQGIANATAAAASGSPVYDPIADRWRGAGGQFVSASGPGSGIPGASPAAQSGFNQMFGGFSQREMGRLFEEGGRIAGGFINLANIDQTHTDSITSARYGQYAGIASDVVGLGVGLLTHNARLGAMTAAGTEAILGPMAEFFARPADFANKSVRLLSGFEGMYSGLGAGAAESGLAVSPGMVPGTIWDKLDHYYAPGGGSSNDFLRGTVRNASPDSAWRPSRLAAIGMTANLSLPDNLQFANPKGNADPALTATYSEVAGGLFAGGIDPMSGGMLRPGVTTHPFANDPRVQQLEAGAGHGLLNTLLAVGGAAVAASRQSIPGARESLTETYTRRAAVLFGNESANVMKSIAPIFGTLPETGGNTADILMQFGAQNTETYLRLQNDNLSSSVDPMTLSRTSASVRSGERLAALARTRARGGGAAAASAYEGEMNDLASLPGGRDSLAYAEAGAKRRSSMLEGFEQSDIENYDIPRARLSGARSRLNDLPYSPGNIFAMDATLIAMNNSQIGNDQARMRSLRASGDLSAEEELRLTRRDEGMLSQSYAAIRDITEGRENLITPLTSGRPRVVGAWDSLQATASAFGNAGLPIRSYGASNGRALAAQNAVAGALGLNEADIAPFSQTGRMNSGGAGGGGLGADPQIVSLLSQILASLRGGGGGPTRNNGDIGGVWSILGSRENRPNTTYDTGAN